MRSFTFRFSFTTVRVRPLSIEYTCAVECVNFCVNIYIVKVVVLVLLPKVLVRFLFPAWSRFFLFFPEIVGVETVAIIQVIWSEEFLLYHKYSINVTVY